MKIPKQVRNAAHPYGTGINRLGTYKGEQVYEVFSTDKNGRSIETGMPIMVFFDGKTARVEISDKNLSVLMAINAS